LGKLERAIQVEKVDCIRNLGELTTHEVEVNMYFKWYLKKANINVEKPNNKSGNRKKKKLLHTIQHLYSFYPLLVQIILYFNYLSI